MKKPEPYAQACAIRQTVYSVDGDSNESLVVIIPVAVTRNGDFAQARFRREGCEYLRQRGFYRLAMFGHHGSWVAKAKFETIRAAKEYENLGFLFDDTKEKEKAKLLAYYRRVSIRPRNLISGIKAGLLTEYQRTYIKGLPTKIHRALNEAFLQERLAKRIAEKEKTV